MSETISIQEVVNLFPFQEDTSGYYYDQSHQKFLQHQRSPLQLVVVSPLTTSVAIFLVGGSLATGVLVGVEVSFRFLGVSFSSSFSSSSSEEESESESDDEPESESSFLAASFASFATTYSIRRKFVLTS